MEYKKNFTIIEYMYSDDHKYTYYLKSKDNDTDNCKLITSNKLDFFKDITVILSNNKNNNNLYTYINNLKYTDNFDEDDIEKDKSFGYMDLSLCSKITETHDELSIYDAKMNLYNIPCNIVKELIYNDVYLEIKQ